MHEMIVRFVFGTLTFALLSTSSCRAPERAVRGYSDDARYELFVLGVAQDGGLPHFGCNRACCEVARATGQRESPACLGIHDRQTGELALIEATPDVELQVARLHELSGVPARGRRPVDAVLLTHAHVGHYLGLAQFGREVASTRQVPVHASPRMSQFLRSEAPWRQLVELEQLQLHEFELGKSFEALPGLRVTARTVPHRDEFSDTVAFTIHGPDTTVLFVPDVDSWAKTPGLLELLIEGVDVAYLDATFFDGRELPDRSLDEIPHPPMIDTMRRLDDAASAQPGRFRFIHLNHSNPAWNDPDLRADLERRGFRIAIAGERVAL